MDHLETAMPEIKVMLRDVLDRLGHPHEGAGATGVYYAIEKVSERVGLFEKIWQMAKGAAIVGVPLIVALWWLGGDKIGHLLRG